MLEWFRKKFARKGTQDTMSRESLAALARGIHHAASSTSAMLAGQYLHLFKQFFDERDGKLYAKMTYIQLDEKHWVPVPLISLVSPRGITLEKMKVNLSVRIEETEAKQATIDGDGSTADRLGFKVSIAPRSRDGQGRQSDITDIEMEFCAGAPPDAIMRIIDQYANMIDSRSFDKAQPPIDTHPPTKIDFSGKKTEKK